MQLSMLGGGLSADPERLRGMRRTALGSGAWVDHLQGWLTDDLEVFDELTRGVEWRSESRTMYERVVDVPRLTAWYDDPQRLPHPDLRRAFDALNDHYAPVSFTTAGLCWYRDGRDSVAWHGDRIRHRANRTLVAIVSLGSARPLLLRPRGGGPSTSFSLGHGDLLVMGGTCQSTWEHCVPKLSHAGPRISVQFREPGVD